jgi:tyrosyl-tRNA synthetase
MVNNADWLLDLNYIDVLREVGAHFTVNRMLAAECYKQRMERGLSFLEFNYMIMQSYDFYKLYKDYGCNLQFGGDDQWSNMLGGTELIRRKLGKDASAMTINLLLNSEGKKMGKTVSGAVWLDPEKTSPYEFFQYWRNVDDSDVIKCLKMLTFVPLEQIQEMENLEGAELNKAKEVLAFELTKLVHGEEEADKALDAAKKIFANGGISGDLPTTTYSKEELDEGKDILTLLVDTKLAASRGEARRLVNQGGVSVNGEKVSGIDATFTTNDYNEDGVILIKKGKKAFHQIKAD